MTTADIATNKKGWPNNKPTPALTAKTIKNFANIALADKRKYISFN
ncbi:hypothetical protein GCM10017161_08930 [Thalassotalea marina]|uniref:Uncharacterized protein n=1 Tax=Thalassotalea marina TaxID=1673741 RepID=A0A919BD57_9GAMM|nr:hypothetical protein GCM10017161_08930 [Thalassotalea marina]